MSILRFVHAADLHLDSPFAGLHGIAPEIATTLSQATFGAYDRLITLCIDEGVDALLVAGDVFDGADRSLRAQITFGEGLKRLDEAGIRSFVCHGNHDPLNGWEAKLALPHGCHRFGPQVERIPVFTEEPDRADDERGRPGDADRQHPEPDEHPEREPPDEARGALGKGRWAKVGHAREPNVCAPRGFSTSCTGCCGNVEN